jgi:hypothetical protein
MIEPRSPQKGRSMRASADEIVGLYERHAEAWDRVRAADPTLERTDHREPDTGGSRACAD